MLHIYWCHTFADATYLLYYTFTSGDEARAKVFAERAYAARTVIEGEDSPETMRAR
jgi:hypothetical protein